MFRRTTLRRLIMLRYLKSKKIILNAMIDDNSNYITDDAGQILTGD
jgi:hypothetical protein